MKSALRIITLIIALLLVPLTALVAADAPVAHRLLLTDYGGNPLHRPARNHDAAADVR